MQELSQNRLADRRVYWLDLDKDSMKGTIRALPVREDLTMPMQEQLIVELYSK